MKRLYIVTILMSMLAAFGAPAVFAGAVKVDVCHVPPGDPDNFHTITISQNALEAHLAHGDMKARAMPYARTCATMATRAPSTTPGIASRLVAR